MEDDAPKFSDFLSADENDSTQPAEVQPEAPETPAEPQLESQPATEDVPAEPVAESQEPVVPSAEEQLTFEGYLRNNGLNVAEDIDQEDFYARAAYRIQNYHEVESENERLRAELENARSSAPAPAPAPVDTTAPPVLPAAPSVNETPEEKGERLFQELKEYDRNLLQYVELDESGRATPKSEYGPAALEAAKEINAYEQAAARQAQLLMRNPQALINENMGSIEQLVEKRANELIESKLADFETKRQEEAAKQREEAAAAAYEDRINSWYDDNKEKFFRLGPNGEPERDLFDPNQYSMTPLGNKFREVYAGLRERLPNADELEVRNIALEQAQLALPAPTPTTPQTPLQQKQQFIQQRQPTVPHQNQPPAPIEDVSQAFNKVRFSEMIMNDPENEHIVSSW